MAYRVMQAQAGNGNKNVNATTKEEKRALAIRTVIGNCPWCRLLFNKWLLLCVMMNLDLLLLEYIFNI